MMVFELRMKKFPPPAINSEKKPLELYLETPVDDRVGAGFGGASVGSVVRVEVGTQIPIGSANSSRDFGDWDSASVVGL